MVYRIEEVSKMAFGKKIKEIREEQKRKGNKKVVPPGFEPGTLTT